MSLVRRKLRSKVVPEGFDRIEDVLNDFELQLRDAVNEEHEGKRRAELTWKVHRLHWEKNRFLYDLMYVKKAMSRELFDFLVSNKVADGALISKWRKPGYELLCSTLAVQRSGTAFGTTALCRVPLKQRAPQQRLQPSVLTGCVSCASGDGRFGGPVWWNTPVAPEEEEGGGGGGGEGGAAAGEHRATWAAAVDPEDADEQDAWEREAVQQQQEEEEEEQEDEPEEEESPGEASPGKAKAAAAAAAKAEAAAAEKRAEEEAQSRKKNKRPHEHGEGEEEEEEEGGPDGHEPPLQREIKERLDRLRALMHEKEQQQQQQQAEGGQQQQPEGG
jgi:bud site selection protein 31